MKEFSYTGDYQSQKHIETTMKMEIYKLCIQCLRSNINVDKLCSKISNLLILSENIRTQGGDFGKNVISNNYVSLKLKDLNYNLLQKVPEMYESQAFADFYAKTIILKKLKSTKHYLNKSIEMEKNRTGNFVEMQNHRSQELIHFISDEIYIGR